MAVIFFSHLRDLGRALGHLFVGLWYGCNDVFIQNALVEFAWRLYTPNTIRTISIYRWDVRGLENDGGYYRRNIGRNDVDVERRPSVWRQLVSIFSGDETACSYD